MKPGYFNSNQANARYAIGKPFLLKSLTDAYAMWSDSFQSTYMDCPYILPVVNYSMGIYLLYLYCIKEIETNQLIKTKNMKYLTTIGRILFALPFGIMGLNHFIMKSYYLGMMSTFIPGGGYTIIITGLALIAACISIIAKKYIQISCLLLALLLFLFILTIHVPGLFDPTDVTILSMHTKFSTLALIELMKDVSLMGGALMIAGIYRNENAV